MTGKVVAPAFVKMRSAAKLCCVFLALAFASSAFGADGTSSSSVGKGVVINTPPAKPVAAEGTAQPLGRRAGPRAQLRQTSTGVGIEDPSLLPDCVPGLGVICSDRDYTKVLESAPSNIGLTKDNYAFFGFAPTASLAASIDNTARLADDAYSTAAKLTTVGGVKANIGNEVLDATNEVATTAVAAALTSRPELAVPAKLALTVGQTKSTGRLERRTNKPNFYYVLGQNFGRINGFSLAADGVAGRR